MLFLIRLSFLREGKYGFERTTLCVRACVREKGMERARASPPRFELLNQVLRSVKNFTLLGATPTHTISFTTIGNNNTEKVRTSEVGAIPAPLNCP
jgi:hypothetical protein